MLKRPIDGGFHVGVDCGTASQATGDLCPLKFSGAACFPHSLQPGLGTFEKISGAFPISFFSLKQLATATSAN